MSKKNKKKTNKTDKPLKSDLLTPEMRGFFLFAGSLMLLLSLFSFAVEPDAKNLMGLMGHTLGWLFHALFGLGSYIVCFYIGWIGWRRVFGKSIHYPILKTSYMLLFLLSTCVLLSLIEDTHSPLANWIGSTFYPGLWLKKQRYHLGGAPFFYFYHDLPFYNLSHLFNTIGVFLIFSSLWIASCYFLFQTPLSHLGETLAEFFKKGMEGSESEEEDDENIEDMAPAEQQEGAKESLRTFLRFLKLKFMREPQAEEELVQTTEEVIAPPYSPDLASTQTERSLRSRRPMAISHSEQIEIEPQEVSIEQETPAVENLSRKGPEAMAPSKKKREAALIAQSIYNGDFTNFALPNAALLTPAKKIDQTLLKKDLKRQAEVLEETLMSFGIEAKVGQINCGPTITSFEVHPAVGVKVQRIKTLDNDIALNMEAKSIRIIAPIPGKAAVGIEVPNPQPQEVGFKDMLVAYQQGAQKFHIPILLGKAVNGDYVMSDLAKMPHCIIAGATGSGKSVCINTIVMSILLNAKPDQIKLIMVDPKKVELTPYTHLPHMLAPVITEPQGAAAALNWLVKEMENRYEILKLVGVRNIDAFNKRTPNVDLEANLGREIPPFMPYIVGIIDELADLMMVASQDIETPIARIAQMARAVGIHLILATQRPSREVITGLIKANFPTRICFKVASRINSQIVLDETGAESLLGNGDMLFLPPGSSNLIRAQGAYIRDEDIQAVVQHICQQAPPNYVIQSFDQMGFDELAGGLKDEMELDSLYDQAEEVVLSTGNASTTFLQRKLKIGYARAASLMDQLEMQGVVGPAEGSKPRKVFGRKDSSNHESNEYSLEDAEY